VEGLERKYEGTRGVGRRFSHHSPTVQRNVDFQPRI
jgi:hypothetical protein